MQYPRADLRRIVLIAAAVAACAAASFGQGVKRLVIVKVDGLPNYYVDRFVHERDPVTGKSKLPWINEVFYKNGSRMVNFYTRGMSLSGPSWGEVDTGQHLQIKGNVEFDRFTLHTYDYLNFLTYYLNYGAKRNRVDMPAVEVMDQLGIPLFSDQFPFEKKYISQQLYQRGNDWAPIAGGFVNMLPPDRSDMIDEWVLGFPLRNMITDQNVRDIVGKLIKRPEIDYLDYFAIEFDHASHHFNDPAIRFDALKDVDRAVGAIWTAVQQSSRVNETALVLVSDHGFNSEEGTISQGFNLVKLLARREGGGHHVITKRRLMLDYSIKGFYPLVPLITTTSNDTYYLKGESTKYPTALVDFDGNERSSIHLRENDLNELHILLKELKERKLAPATRTAAIDECFAILDRHRAGWQQTLNELRPELDALHRWIDARQKVVSTLIMKAPKGKGLGRVAENNRRLAAMVDIAVKQEADYRAYMQTLDNLLSLKRETFDPKKVEIEQYIAPGAMGERNSTYDLQNYVVGLSDKGLVTDADGKLDEDQSFTRVNYFDLFHEQRVRSNVQENVAVRPIDFVATRIPRQQLPERLAADQDGVWLYGSEEKQALLLTKVNEDGSQSYRYLPVSGLRQDASGRVSFEGQEWGAGFPLKFFEDPELAVPAAERAAWLSNWHSEDEWLNATHKTIYSNAIIGLNEQMLAHPIEADTSKMSEDEKLINNFRQEQRRLVEADMLIHANNHWNFDVRGFNPGGNHGSFYRVSTNATFMIAGGQDTGIPRALTVETPYDNLSVVPTLMRLMGKIDDNNRPTPEAYQQGYRHFPGRVVKEVIPK
jgi:hypothetical protein